jgi:hypothetical protein
MLKLSVMSVHYRRFSYSRFSCGPPPARISIEHAILEQDAHIWEIWVKTQLWNKPEATTIVQRPWKEDDTHLFFTRVFLFAEPQSYYGTHEYVPETFVISHGSLEIPSPTGVQVGTGPGATVSIPSVSIRPPTEEAMECPWRSTILVLKNVGGLPPHFRSFISVVNGYSHGYPPTGYPSFYLFIC